MQNTLINNADSSSRSHFRSWDFHFKFAYTFYLMNPMNDFHSTSPNFPHSEAVRRIHDSVKQTQGQGYTSRSWDSPFKFVSAPYLLKPLKDFHYTGQMFISVRQYAESMTHLCRIKVKVTVQGHGFYP